MYSIFLLKRKLQYRRNKLPERIKYMEILFEDDDLIVCKKPAGVLAQSDRSFDIDMVSALMTRETKKGNEAYITVINRLDRPVSGIMIFAKNREMAALLTNYIREHNISKQYYAVVMGDLEGEGQLVDYLLRNGKNNTSKVVGKAVNGAKKAILNYKVLDTKEINGKKTTLVKIDLITGRHHQIRVQFANNKNPLYADAKYGEGIRGENVALCAYSLEFVHPKTKENMHFQIKPEGSVFEYYF